MSAFLRKRSTSRKGMQRSWGWRDALEKGSIKTTQKVGKMEKRDTVKFLCLITEENT